MEILLYKIPQDSDLQIGLQVCYKSLNGAFTQLGIITDTLEYDGFTMYIINTSMGAYLADELRLINQLNQDNITALSNEFSRIVLSWCSMEQLNNINRLNSTKEYAGCCATHEYYDTNEAMLQAFTKTFDREFTFFNDETPESKKQYSIDTDYFNAAWQLSKKNKFAVPVVIDCPFDEPFIYNPSSLIN